MWGGRGLPSFEFWREEEISFRREKENGNGKERPDLFFDLIDFLLEGCFTTTLLFPFPFLFLLSLPLSLFLVYTYFIYVIQIFYFLFLFFFFPLLLYLYIYLVCTIYLPCRPSILLCYAQHEHYVNIL